MLFDDLRETAGQHEPPMREALASIGSAVGEAARYELTYDVVRLMVELEQRQSKSVEKSLPLCFLPYPKVWVEYVYQDLLRAHNDVIGGDLPSIPEAAPPSRMGYLFEQVGPHLIRLQMAWTHKNVEPIPAGVFAGDPFPLKIFFPRLTQPCLGCYLINTDPKLHTKDFEDRLDVIPSPHAKLMIRLLMSHLDKVDEHALARVIHHDMRGEWKLALAMLILLNSKNLVHYEDAPRTPMRPHKKRANQPAIKLPYRTVDLKLSRVQYNRANAAGMSREEMRRHIVVAHLKVRKTGVFLWSAHVRGKIGDAHLPQRKVRL